MAGLILILLFLIFVWIVICFLITKLLVRLTIKLTNSKLVVSEKLIFFASTLLAGLSIYLFLFTTPAENYKTAYIQTYENSYKITVKGKRVGMSHDPVSAILSRSYEDSMIYIIPGRTGIIQGDEIEVKVDLYRPTGTITIDKQNMVIELFYDVNKTSPDTWNGNYLLEIR